MENTEEILFDITDLKCPMTFVKTKLFLESLDPGTLVIIRLNGGEPLENIPKSVEFNGHKVTKIEPEFRPGPENNDITNGKVYLLHLVC